MLKPAWLCQLERARCQGCSLSNISKLIKPAPRVQIANIATLVPINPICAHKSGICDNERPIKVKITNTKLVSSLSTSGMNRCGNGSKNPTTKGVRIRTRVIKFSNIPRRFQTGFKHRLIAIFCSQRLV